MPWGLPGNSDTPTEPIYAEAVHAVHDGAMRVLEEIGIENKAVFLKAGGKNFHHIPCLNDGHEWIQAMARIVADNLHSWATSDYDRGKTEREAQQSAARAKELGARS